MSFDEILSREEQLAASKGVWGGAIGASLGYVAANRMNARFTPTLVAILAGHFAGHSVSKQLWNE